jgi:hypothetical protein
MHFIKTCFLYVSDGHHVMAENRYQDCLCLPIAQGLGEQRCDNPLRSQSKSGGPGFL